MSTRPSTPPPDYYSATKCPWWRRRPLAASKRALIVGLLPRTTPSSVILLFSMLLSGSLFCTFYCLLTLGCCAGGALDEAPRRREPVSLTALVSGSVPGSPSSNRVIVVRDGEEDETKYQRVLEETGTEGGGAYLHYRRKPLLDQHAAGAGDLLNSAPLSNSDNSAQPAVFTSSRATAPRPSARRRHKSANVGVVSRYDGVADVDVDDDDDDDELRYDVSDGQDYDSRVYGANSNHEHSNQVVMDTSRTMDAGLRGPSLGLVRTGLEAPSAPVSARRLPQAIIIGVKKGGTRALLEFLRMHPDVRAPGPEPHFFDRNYEKGLDWYRRQMPATFEDQITMEKTPGYFVTKGVPARIYNMSKNVKFIVVVRDPVTRAISDYAQALAKRSDISSFETMAFEDNSTGLVDTSWGAIRIGVYAKHLERWLQYFPLSQMHFVSGERLISDPAGEIGKVQDFLGLERLVTDKNFLYNSTKGFPCLVRPDRKKPHCLSKTKGREHPKVDPKVSQRLRDFFRPFNQKFYQMVGQDFGWS